MRYASHSPIDASKTLTLECLSKLDLENNQMCSECIFFVKNFNATASETATAAECESSFAI